MKRFHAPYDLDQYPVAATFGRLALAVVVTGTMAAALATAGPGNGYQAPETWAAVHRPDVVRVQLPKVQVLGERADGQSVAAVSCPKGA